MKNTIVKLFVISIFFNISLFANENLPDRGGKFGRFINTTEEMSVIDPLAEFGNGLSINRTVAPPPPFDACNTSYGKTHIYLKHELHARWWEYYAWHKVAANAFTRSTYGSTIADCGTPYLSANMRIDIYLSDYWDHFSAFGNYSVTMIKEQSLANTDYHYVDGNIWQTIGAGKRFERNVLSYHSITIGNSTYFYDRALNWN